MAVKASKVHVRTPGSVFEERPACRVQFSLYSPTKTTLDFSLVTCEKCLELIKKSEGVNRSRELWDASKKENIKAGYLRKRMGSS